MLLILGALLFFTAIFKWNQDRNSQMNIESGLESEQFDVWKSNLQSVTANSDCNKAFTVFAKCLEKSFFTLLEEQTIGTFTEARAAGELISLLSKFAKESGVQFDNLNDQQTYVFHRTRAKIQNEVCKSKESLLKTGFTYGKTISEISGSACKVVKQFQSEFSGSRFWQDDSEQPDFTN
jgi:hypothetical protein